MKPEVGEYVPAFFLGTLSAAPTVGTKLADIDPTAPVGAEALYSGYIYKWVDVDVIVKWQVTTVT